MKTRWNDKDKTTKRREDGATRKPRWHNEETRIPRPWHDNVTPKTRQCHDNNDWSPTFLGVDDQGLWQLVLFGARVALGGNLSNDPRSQWEINVWMWSEETVHISYTRKISIRLTAPFAIGPQCLAHLEPWCFATFDPKTMRSTVLSRKKEVSYSEFQYGYWNRVNKKMGPRGI